MTLYEISEAWKTLNDVIDNSELDEEAFKQAFDDLGGQLAEKAENIVKTMKNIEADVEAFKAEEKRLYERRKTLEGRVLRLKNYLYNNLKEMGYKHLDAGLFDIRIQSNAPSVNIINEEAIPEAYKIYEPKIDKKAILNTLKNKGDVVPGVELYYGESLRIR